MKSDEVENNSIKKSDPNLTFQPHIDDKSKKIMNKKHKKINSFMDPTLTQLNRVNETKFHNVVRRMSLDAEVVKLLSTTYMDSKRDYYQSKTLRKRGKSVCFMETLKKGENKIKEMEDILDQRMFLNRNLNKIEYDGSLRFLVEIAEKKKNQY